MRRQILTIAISFSLTLGLLACSGVDPRVQKAHPQTVPSSIFQAQQQQPVAQVKLPVIDFTPSVAVWVDAAVLRNASVAEAKARLDEAQAQFGNARGALLPELSANLSGSDGKQRREQIEPAGENDLPLRSERRQGTLEFRWELDLFGAKRKRARAASALSEASAADLHAAQQSIAAELQRALVERYAAAARQQHYQKLLTTLAQTEVLEKALADRGLRNSAEWLRVRSERQVRINESDRDALALKTHQLRLRALSDRPIDEIDALIEASAAPTQCALDNGFSMPLTMLALRPDVRAARWRLQAALQDADAAQLDRLPSIHLNGSTGTNRQRDSDIFSAMTKVFDNSFGLSITQKLFAGGRLKADANAAAARSAALAAAYQQRLLLAAEETDIAIANAKQNSASRERLHAALADSERLNAISQVRFKAGIDSRLDALRAEREMIERRLTAIDGDRDQCLAAINLRLAIVQAWPAQGWPTSTQPPPQKSNKDT
jgi:outer membrane protein, multidrug efflux system